MKIRKKKKQRKFKLKLKSKEEHCNKYLLKLTNIIKILLIFSLTMIYIYFIKSIEQNNVSNNISINPSNYTSILQEIISFENNLHLTPEIFDEFRQINSDNKLIEGNKEFKKSDNPDVTIIITNYNQAYCIHKALRSVQNQSLKNIEIIIVDDCSFDNSTEIIKEYQKDDERIILISHDTNEGTLKSRFDAVKIAKGKYITIVDGDDALIHKDILKNCFYIAQKSGIDVLEFPARRYIDGKFTEIKYNYSDINVSYIIIQPELRTKFFYTKNKIISIHNRVIWGKFIKKEIFKELITYLGSEIVDDYINEAEDTLMAVGVFHLAKSYYIMNEIGYYYTTFTNKYISPKLENKVCTTNNKTKRFGWYKYLKFLVDKNTKTEKEKDITYEEFGLIYQREIFGMSLDNRHYQLMFYVWDKLLEFNNLNQQQRNYINDLKNKARIKMKRDNINFIY